MKTLESSDVEQVRGENAMLKAKLRALTQQITMLQAELRRSEAYSADLKRMMDELRHQVIDAPPKPSCAFCHKPFEHPATGRKARFCSALCRLHYHRETKRNNNVSTQEENP